MEDPFVPSGTVLPVVFRSNIERQWVVALPDGMRTAEGADRMGVPLAHLHLAGSRAKADAYAEEFARFALTYAETLQSGLPLRANAENNARRVYRLREGEIVKVLEMSEKGVPPLGVTGEPLPGNWYRVLTVDGTVGYTFSYRLRFFDHTEGFAVATSADIRELLDRTWIPEAQLAMIASGRIDLEQLRGGWRFEPGLETGIARIVLDDIQQIFAYTEIVPDGNSGWRFSGSGLSVRPGPDSTLAVQFTDSGGILRSHIFAGTDIDIEQVILGEEARRAERYGRILRAGPVFAGNTHGTLGFAPEGEFSWSDFGLLVPRHIPRSAAGRGRVSMDLFLSPSMAERYDGALTMYFADSGREEASLPLLYVLDDRGLRLEIVPRANIDERTVFRRSASPEVMQFYPVENDDPAGREEAGEDDPAADTDGSR